jgi:hypothetical protein
MFDTYSSNTIKKNPGEEAIFFLQGWKLKRESFSLFGLVDINRAQIMQLILGSWVSRDSKLDRAYIMTSS